VDLKWKPKAFRTESYNSDSKQILFKVTMRIDIASLALAAQMVAAARPPPMSETNQLSGVYPGGLDSFIHSLPQDEQDVFFRLTANISTPRAKPSKSRSYWGWGFNNGPEKVSTATPTSPASSPALKRPHRPRPLSKSMASQTSTKSPRLVLYQQTHHGKDGKVISLLPLIKNNTGVTHVYIAALHVHSPDEKNPIHLNDHPPDDPRYDQMWSEVKELQDAGIVVMGMLGGAAGGTYVRLSTSGDIVRIFDFFVPGVRSSMADVYS
jgi:hypothetical protein